MGSDEHSAKNNLPTSSLNTQPGHSNSDGDLASEPVVVQLNDGHVHVPLHATPSYPELREGHFGIREMRRRLQLNL
ncbi:MAG TPA: hypothetical protein PKI03_15360 [Pseudomonadota bacterium]|nr:hypothetical protein [Pseudomonadota bacterium]